MARVYGLPAHCERAVRERASGPCIPGLPPRTAPARLGWLAALVGAAAVCRASRHRLPQHSTPFESSFLELNDII